MEISKIETENGIEIYGNMIDHLSLKEMLAVSHMIDECRTKGWQILYINYFTKVMVFIKRTAGTKWSFAR